MNFNELKKLPSSKVVLNEETRRRSERSVNRSYIASTFRETFSASGFEAMSVNEIVRGIREFN